MPAPFHFMSNQPSSFGEKEAALNAVRKGLKEEFFGIDAQIDQIIDSIRAWYLMPEVISYPVIINLWSMTGNGKTALVRSLVDRLDFRDSFFEAQLSDSGIITDRGDISLPEKLSFGGLSPCKPGIILLDEFQRYRTVDARGDDNKLQKDQEIWMLLSDGSFPYPNKIKTLHKLYDNLFKEMVEEERDGKKVVRQVENPELLDKEVPTGGYGSWAYDDIHCLTDNTLKDTDIEQMTRKQVWEHICDYRSKLNGVYDYRKTLIFIAGNLDEAFTAAANVADCDTDADVFHAATKRLSFVEIKEALLSRFRPEQISRLGSNHIIYPSLNAEAYRKIIRKTCNTYLEKAKEVSGISFELDSSVINEIYNNSVFPTQGTRPVFSSIHKMFGSPLSEGIIWAIRNDCKEISLKLDSESSSLILKSGELTFSTPVKFEIRDRKNRYSNDYSALIAAHEMGHAILFSELMDAPPQEIKINVASFTGGYNSFAPKHYTSQSVRDAICIAYGGIAAEEILFGRDMLSAGSEGDISSATELAARYVRFWEMDRSVGRADVVMHQATKIADYEKLDKAISEILRYEKSRAIETLYRYRDFLIKSSRDLFEKKSFTAEEFKEYAAGVFQFKADLSTKVDISGNYYEKLMGAKLNNQITD